MVVKNFSDIETIFEKYRTKVKTGVKKNIFYCAVKGVIFFSKGMLLLRPHHRDI
jgi:hypothetical protein